MGNSEHKLKLYLAIIYAASIGASVICFTADRSFDPEWQLLTFAAVIVGTVNLRLPAGISGVVSMGDVFVIFALLQFGAAPALVTNWLQSTAAGLSEFSRREGIRALPRIPRRKILFNIAQCGLSICGMHVARSAAQTIELSAAIQPVVELGAIGVAWFAINTSVVSGAIAFSSGQSFSSLMRETSGLALLNALVSAAAAGLIRIFYTSSTLVFLLSLPLLAVLYQLYSFYIQKYESAQRHISELNRLYLQTIESLASAVDAKDRYTHGHIRRVQAYSVALARAMNITDENELMSIRFGALLHDIGKIAIPEFILNKPTVLTEAEFEKMKIHPAIGAEMLKGIEFPFPVQPLVRSHHERWDGKGYPDGLSGDAIPLGARILSVVDCYDALTTNRPYRAPMPRAEVLAFFQRESGRAYDPVAVNVLAQHIEKIEEVGRDIPEPTLDIWESDAAQSRESPALRPLERVQPAANFAKAMKVSGSTQRELYTLFEFVRAARCLTRGDILSFIGTKLEALIDFDAGVFYLVPPDQAVMFPVHIVGNGKREFPEGVRLSLDAKLSGWVAANNQAISNLPPGPDFETVQGRKPDFAISAIAPMVHGGRVIGAISLYRKSREKFSDTECRHLEIIAGQTSSALDRLPQEDDDNSALFDEITGLPNGYQLFLMFDQVAIDSLRYDYPLGLLAFRLENLTEVRRKFGHVSADVVLRSVSSRLNEQVRESDILVRYAEDVFLSLHPRMTRGQAEAMKLRVQEDLDDERVPVRHGVYVTAKVSVGICEYPSDGSDLQELVAVVDWRLNEDRSQRDDRTSAGPLRFPSQ